MVLQFPTTNFFACVLYKNGVAKRYLPDVFLTQSEANIYAKEYLNLRSKKKLSIKVEKRTYCENTIT